MRTGTSKSAARVWEVIETNAFGSDEKKTARKAIKQMPKRDAEILLLKYTEDWSYKQLAEHLGISESAVEARLHRARQRFRAELTNMAVI